MATVTTYSANFISLTGNQTSSHTDYTPTGYDPSSGHSGLTITGLTVGELVNDEVDETKDPDTYGGTVSTNVNTTNNTVSVQISGLTGSDTGRTFVIAPIVSYDDGTSGAGGDPIINTLDGKSYRL
mgnify:CR=1 FL=1